MSPVTCRLACVTGSLYLIWLAIVSSAFMYNAVACPLRASFRRAYFHERAGRQASNLCTVSASVFASPSTTLPFATENITNLDLDLYTSSPLSLSANYSFSSGSFLMSSIVDEISLTTFAPSENSSDANNNSSSSNTFDVTTVSPLCKGGGNSDDSPDYIEGYETDDNRMYWWLCDYICDLIYVLDIVLIKRRLRFIKDGIWQV